MRSAAVIVVVGLLGAGNAGADDRFVRRAGVEWPFMAEPDRLLVTFDDHDRAAGRRIGLDALRAQLAPVLASLRLVEVPTRSLPDLPLEHCDGGAQIVVARRDGRAFRADGERALARLRSATRVRSAGPLIRGNPRRSGELALGRVIRVYAMPNSASAAMTAFAAAHHATWDAAALTLTLPDDIGLAAADLANALPAEVPGAAGDLDLEGVKICLD